MRSSKHITRSRRLGVIERDLMENLSAGDLLYGVLLSGYSTRRMMKLAAQRATYRYRRKCALERLIRAGLVRKRADLLSLTAAGEKALGIEVGRTLAKLGRNKWDGRWRIVAFDVPQRYAPMRRRIRGILRAAGFVKLQQSIWIFPHECTELVKLMQTESRLSRHVLYGVLEHIEGAERLKKVFKLRTK